MIADRIIFLHIPKTAGTSIRSAFSRLLDDDEILGLYPKTDWAFEPEEIADIPARRRRSARLVIGHVKHGIAEHFPGTSLYATVLRDPVERVLSSYYLHERAIERDGPGNQLQRAIAAGDLDLASFARNPGNRNLQTRYLAGKGSGKRMLSRAIEHISSEFVAIGLTDQTDVFVKELVKATEWGRPPRVRRLNRNESRPPAREEPAELLEEIAELNQADTSLIAHVTDLTDRGRKPILRRG